MKKDQDFRFFENLDLLLCGKIFIYNDLKFSCDKIS